MCTNGHTKHVWTGLYTYMWPFRSWVFNVALVCITMSFKGSSCQGNGVWRWAACVKVMKHLLILRWEHGIPCVLSLSMFEQAPSASGEKTSSLSASSEMLLWLYYRNVQFCQCAHQTGLNLHFHSRFDIAKPCLMRLIPLPMGAHLFPAWTEAAGEETFN